MASLALQLRNQHRKPPQILLKSTPNITLSYLFSSSSSSDNDNGNSPKASTYSSYFSVIKSRLKHQEQQQQQQSMGLKPFNLSPQNSSNPSLHENNDLAEFRRRSQPNLLQDLYHKRNMENPNPNPRGENVRKSLSFETIRESLSKLRRTNPEKGENVNDRLSLNKYKENFRPSTALGNKVYGGSTDVLPASVFGKELRERQKKKGEEGKGGGDEDMEKIAFMRMYPVDELGKKLRELRPEVAKNEKGEGGEENWFSLVELNERLKKLKKIEEEQPNKVGFLRQSMQHMLAKDDKKPTMQRFNILGELGGTQSFMMSPPKEHLVEKYFHPDNMSSEEKLKLELKKVRDEFKMHESDCGSARVQIAQLTTEIIHLSSVLHKKDKHSRRGLLAKVHQRKKLLKYLRRTDWDSYCLVLSKLGLRDNPDYKN